MPNLCPVCRNERLIYYGAERYPSDLLTSLVSKYGYIFACGADPRHDVNVLVYDVELP